MGVLGILTIAVNGLAGCDPLGRGLAVPIQSLYSATPCFCHLCHERSYWLKLWVSPQGMRWRQRNTSEGGKGWKGLLRRAPFGKPKGSPTLSSPLAPQAAHLLTLAWGCNVYTWPVRDVSTAQDSWGLHRAIFLPDLWFDTPAHCNENRKAPNAGVTWYNRQSFLWPQNWEETWRILTCDSFIDPTLTLPIWFKSISAQIPTWSFSTSKKPKKTFLGWADCRWHLETVFQEWNKIK